MGFLVHLIKRDRELATPLTRPPPVTAQAEHGAGIMEAGARPQGPPVHRSRLLCDTARVERTSLTAQIFALFGKCERDGIAESVS